MAIKLNLEQAQSGRNLAGIRWTTNWRKLPKPQSLEMLQTLNYRMTLAKSSSALMCSSTYPIHNYLSCFLKSIEFCALAGFSDCWLPNLAVIAKAYIEKDEQYFQKLLKEDESIRTDLGFGGMFMNFIVSPGQDTVLLNRDLNTFVAGYAHLYSYDYEMLSTILKRLGYMPRRVKFGESSIEELTEPLHVIGLEPVWQNFNQEFYTKIISCIN